MRQIQMMTRTVGVVLLLCASACASGKAAGPAGDPLRPEAKALPPVVAVQDKVPVSQPAAQAADDCEAVAPNQSPPPPKAYKDLDIKGGAAQADQGLRELIQSEKNIPPEDVAAKIEGAVQKFFGALAADPYNINATYNLAAAYARIGRNQCALNLLARMAAMKDFPTRKKAIAAKADRLFGRGKKWKDKPDPDFQALRGKPEFESIVAKLK